MAGKILVAYASRFGSTQEVAQVIAEALGASVLEVDLCPAREVRHLDGYTSVVLGAPLFMFRWHKDALRFLARQRAALQERSVAVFALGPVHEPHDEAEWKDSRRQLDEALKKFPWFKPAALEIFGGKYDPSRLRFPLKLFAGEVPPSDIRNWDAIRAWAEGLPPILVG